MFHFRQKYPSDNLDCYRELCKNINHTKGRCQTILIASSVSGEDKSLVAMNLARCLAQKHRVLLIEGNLRSPSLTQHLHLSQRISSGLYLVLMGKATLHEVIYTCSTLKLDVIFAGAVPKPKDLKLDEIDMSNTLAPLKKQYDMIIIDTPAVDKYDDAYQFVSCADGVILVVKQDYALKTVVQETYQSFTMKRIKVFGAVFTSYKENRNKKR